MKRRQCGFQPVKGKLAAAYSGECETPPAVSSDKSQSGRRQLRRNIPDSGDSSVSVIPAGAKFCHESFNSKCPRCWFVKFRSKWQRSHGSFLQQSEGQRVRTAWLAERPASLAGEWAVGCAPCAALRARAAQSDSRARHLRRRFDTKFARYEIRTLSQMQASSFQNHAESDIHKRAIRGVSLPDAPLESLILGSREDEELLSGSDWLRCWRMIKSPVSYNKAAAQSVTETYIAIRKKSVTRYTLKRMVLVMVEIVRRRKREALKNSSCCSVALDDKAPYRVIRFRACSKTLQGEGEESCVITGVAAVLKYHGTMTGTTTRDLEEDYGIKVADSVKAAFQMLCTPEGDDTNDALLQHILNTVKACTTDGAAAMKKSMALMRGRCLPNLSVTIVDRAHQIRRAALAITLEPRFKSFWDHFGRVIPALQNSDAWRLRFAVLQREAPTMPNLRRAVTTLSYAKQRFDSSATPQARYCLMLEPIASDERLEAGIRCKSQKMLESMTAEHALTAGLATDFGLEVLQYVRLNDRADHDISAVLRERDFFLGRLRQLFLEGRVLCEPEATDVGTFAFQACRNAMQCATVQFCDRLHTMWGPMSKSQCQSVMTSAQACVDATIARVMADCHCSDSHVALLGLDFEWDPFEQFKFSCFDLQLWQAAREKMRQGDAAAWQATRLDQIARFKMVMKLTGQEVDKALAVTEFESQVAVFLADKATLSRCRKDQDCRPAWRTVLSGSLEALKPSVRLYLCVLDGECSVERDLSQLRSFLQECKGPLDLEGVTVGHLLELRLDGPQREEEIAVQASVAAVESSCGLQFAGCAALQMTDFTRSCQELWIEWFGRRFRSYRKRADAGKVRVPSSRGVSAKFKGQRETVRKLCSMSTEELSSARTFLGHRVNDFARPNRYKLADSPAWCTELRKFQKNTVRKAQAGQADRTRRKLGLRAPKPELRTGSVMQGPAGAGLRDNAVILDFTKDGIQQPLAGRVKRPQGEQVNFQVLQTATVVVVDDLSAVEQMRAGTLDAI
ncbi:unnamed protein product [Symbiodinium natans]|uniref:Uncharacterized protein n=1 Tax=Symbiodinium natans TaxID=878477 RepID=A0A812LA64_9DINO|nr:unnamed protein product [Symbiodinium natans]CAE7238469.1 unnamed protein product [Symbiodinium natans]